MSRQEIIGKDGLLHCSECGERTEELITLPFTDISGAKNEMKVRVLCACEREQRKKKEIEARKRDEMRAIENLRRLSLIEEKLSNARLSTFVKTEENAKLLRIISNYIANFDRMYADNQGLLLWGSVGTGKSYAAAVIANELLDRKVPVVMTSFIKMLKEVGTFHDNSGKIEKLNQAKLLIIDDLGAERGTDYSLEMVYDIIDSRYRAKKPIILTTNLTMEQMKSCEDTRYGRIYDRIFEMCYPVKVSGLSWRKREAASRYASTKKILEG